MRKRVRRARKKLPFKESDAQNQTLAPAHPSKTQEQAQKSEKMDVEVGKSAQGGEVDFDQMAAEMEKQALKNK